MSAPPSRVELSEQVVGFVRRQPPEDRHRLRVALRKLAHEQGDLRALEGPLSPFFRLRVGAYRVILAYAVGKAGRRAIRCIFAERRSVVYVLIEEMLREKLAPGS